MTRNRKREPSATPPARLVWLLALILPACGPAGVEGRIRSVETGLVEDLSAPGWKGRTLQERMAHHGVPGVGLAVIDGYELSWARGYGTRRAGSDEPVTPETLFQTASIGKPVVAAVALRFVQAGRLDLDEDVNAKLRAWRVPENELTAKAPVTLRRLLSHTAGTTYHGYRGYARGAPLPTLPQILDGLPPANSPPIRVESLPGEQRRYSNGGFLIAQQLVTDVAGKPFAEVMDECAFAPLGMKDSRLHPLPEELYGRAAWGHRAGARAVPGGWRVYPETGAGPFWSTPADMARFGAALMRAHEGLSDRWLAPDLARVMLTPRLEKYGLGIGVQDDGGDRFHALHDGGNDGFRALIVLYPKRGQGAVIMTNADSGDRLAEEIMNSLSREYGWVAGLVMRAWMVAALAGGLALLLVFVFVRRARRLRRGATSA